MAKLLKSIKVHILFGYITLIAIASVAVWLIYDETLELYDNQVDINPASEKIFLANSILTNLYEAEGLERSYLQTGSPENYEAYNLLIDSISSQIVMLGLIEGNPAQTVHTDSIQKLLTKKRENLKELNAIKNSASAERLYERALFKLTENKDSLQQLFQMYENLNQSKDSIQTKQKKARFFERLKNVFAPPEEPDSTLQIVVNESVQVDSLFNAFNPTDSVEQIMASIIREIRKESVAFEKQLMQAEQENLQNAQTITLQIRQILSKLESEEILFSLNKVADQQQHISQMKNIVIILGIAAILIIIGFLILILKDITKSQHYRQNLEKEKAYSESLLRSKEQLMLSITHDLKSPLNSIIGFAHLATKETNQENQNKYLKNIDHSAGYVLRLTKDLLDFARLESGKLTIESRPLNLKKLIEEAVTGFFPLAEEKKLELILNLEKLPDRTYITDGARLNQILSNLISNAIKFTNQGYIKINGSIKKSRGKTDWIQIEIEDTGIGISKENNHIIFEEFGRITSDDDVYYEGTGLGLPITKRIVELLKGSISYSSKYGEGSHFTVVLPLNRQSNKTAAAPPAIPPTPKVLKSVFNKERVLLVDDDPFLLELATHILKEANLEVFPFSQARKAREIMNKQNFDILITDVQMPGTNGFELLTCFKAQKPTATLAIAVTGEANDQQHYLEAGFQAVIQKPFQPDNLLETVAAVLDGYSKPVNDAAPTEKTLHNAYNIEGIKAFAGGEMDTTREILVSFAQSTQQNLQQFRLHRQKEDYDEIKKLAHKMLPMFRQLEAIEIIEPLRKLEQDYYNRHENKWLQECDWLLVNIDKLMEQIIEDHQLPFSGKLIS